MYDSKRHSTTFDFHLTRFVPAENEPLIPKDTMFYMTTHPALAPPEASSSSLPINSGGYERYFEKSDVIKAYREQQLIETPEFWSTAEGGENVVSRFRPRPVEGVRRLFH